MRLQGNTLWSLLGSRASSLAHRVFQTETLQMLCLQGSVAGSGIGRGVARWIPEVASRRGTWRLATWGVSHLAGLEHASPQVSSQSHCPPATGFSLPPGPFPALPASPADAHLLSPTTRMVVDIYCSAF